MLKRLTLGPKLVLALGVAGAAFGIATVVQAAIPDSNGVIHGCYQFATASVPKGTLRVIDPRESCRYYERPLNWNGNGVGGIFAISGPIDQSIPGGEPPPWVTPDWNFEGNTALVTVGDTQSILADVSGSLGVTNIIGARPRQPAQGFEFGFGVCFQNTVGGGEGGAPVVNMNQFSGGDNNNFAANFYEPQGDFTGIGVVTPGAGTYNVGYCVQNYGVLALNDNNWANGHAEVVDGVVDTSGVSQTSGGH